MINAKSDKELEDGITRSIRLQFIFGIMALMCLLAFFFAPLPLLSFSTIIFILMAIFMIVESKTDIIRLEMRLKR